MTPKTFNVDKEININYSLKTLLIVVYRILGAADDRIECIVSSTPQYSAVLHNMVGTVFMDLERNLESVTALEKFNHSGMYIYAKV